MIRTDKLPFLELMKKSCVRRAYVMTPPTRLHFSRGFSRFCRYFFAKTGTFRNPESNRRSHDSALRSLTKLPDKRELADRVTNRAVEQSNEYRQTIRPELSAGACPPVPKLSAGTARPTNGNLTFTEVLIMIRMAQVEDLSAMLEELESLGL
jgi:hypothetical protein